MKYNIVSIAVTLPIILAAGIFFMAYTHTIANTFIDTTRRLEENARNGQWDHARQVLEDMSSDWDSKKSLLQLWVVHADTDDVSKYLGEARVGLALQDRSLLFVSTANLIESLEHLHHKDDLNLSNIL